MKKFPVVRLCRGALVGALYLALTLLSAALGLSSGLLPFGLQCRLSEALCVLPLLLPEAVAGLTVGCLLGNLLSVAPWQDVVFGTLATLLAALLTLPLRRLPLAVGRALASLPAVLCNSIIIPLVLRYAYGLGEAMWIYVLSVALGELISATLLGGLLLRRLTFTPKRRHKDEL